jgi:hypothetical protein
MTYNMWFLLTNWFCALSRTRSIANAAKRVEEIQNYSCFWQCVLVKTDRLQIWMAEGASGVTQIRPCRVS